MKLSAPDEVFLSVGASILFWIRGRLGWWYRDRFRKRACTNGQDPDCTTDRGAHRIWVQNTVL